MSQTRKSLRLTPVLLFGLPLVTIVFLCAMIAVIVGVSDHVRFVSPASLLIGATLIYAATIFFLTRNGLAAVRDLEALATSDELSGLPNRRALYEDLERSAVCGEELALALIDLDSFKQVNDHHGHAVGDELIRACARTLREVCGEDVTCYRLGGDEFALAMTGKLAGTILEGIGRSVLQRLAAPLTVGDKNITIGASIGLAHSHAKERLPFAELLRRSDVAMYMSKRGGKMRCTWFNPAFDKQREAVRAIENDLATALARDELSLRYQPLVDSGSGAIVAVESLLRWERPGGETISPTKFIPIAEDTGAIDPIGDWVLRQALRDALGWDGIQLCVNISAAQLRNPDFPIKLGEALEEIGFPPERLELEITETCLVLDPIVAERTLDVIRGFGITISLDDFGTGYASIGFLRQFRFGKLKLDRSLITQAGKDDGSRAMMLSSIAMARALDMQVTAEGVETREQADMVRVAGADQIQGWLYYGALHAREIDALHSGETFSNSANALGAAGTGEEAA